MDLTIWECKKIIKKRSFKIFSAVVFIYVLLLEIWNGAFYLSDNTLSGMQYIKEKYECADNLKGPLTNEKLVAIKNQLNKAYANENMVTEEDGSEYLSDESYNKYEKPLSNIPFLIHDTFMNIPEYSSYHSINKIPQNFFENYYDKRDSVIYSNLDNKLDNDEDKAFFIKQNESLKKPFIYDWTEGHEDYIRIINLVYLVTALFLCVSLAPLFSCEFKENTANILLCSKYGRKKLAKAKIKAASIITIVTFTVSLCICLSCQFLFLGTRGLDSPVQLINPLATVSMSVWKAEVYAIVLGVLSCTAVVSFTISLSSKLTSSSLVIAISLLTIFGGLFLKNTLPEFAKDLVRLFPFAADYRELFNINLYHIFGFRIWSPYMMIIVPMIVILICMPLSIFNYNKKES